MKHTVKSGIILKLTDDSTLKEEGFSIKQIGEAVYIEAKTDKGLLYGSFDLIRRIAQGQSIRGLNITGESEQFPYVKSLG